MTSLKDLLMILYWVIVLIWKVGLLVVVATYVGLEIFFWDTCRYCREAYYFCRQAYLLTRDPFIYIPPYQIIDRAEDYGGVIPLCPANRPSWENKPFHNKPLMRAMRVFRMMGRTKVSWEELLDLYEKYKEEQYG